MRVEICRILAEKDRAITESKANYQTMLDANLESIERAQRAEAQVVRLLCIVHRLDREILVSGRTQVTDSIMFRLGITNEELRCTLREAKAAWEQRA
jgi:hypothetical protein